MISLYIFNDFDLNVFIAIVFKFIFNTIYIFLVVFLVVLFFSFIQFVKKRLYLYKFIFIIIWKRYVYFPIKNLIYYCLFLLYDLFYYHFFHFLIIKNYINKKKKLFLFIYIIYHKKYPFLNMFLVDFFNIKIPANSIIIRQFDLLIYYKKNIYDLNLRLLYITCFWWFRIKFLFFNNYLNIHKLSLFNKSSIICLKKRNF